jgi:tripartite-type tricarboxylate transporter receptor subunit TctC
VPNFEVASWNGIEAPAGTPAPVVNRLTAAFQAALAEPDLVAKFRGLGVETWTGSPADLAARMRSEITRWNRVVNEAHIDRQ